jgi:hypothetical protein
MIEEAIVDAYSEAEQAVGLHATLEQHLQCPFESRVLGMTVTVRKIDVTTAGNIVAIYYRGRERQTILILELPLPDPPPFAQGGGIRQVSAGVEMRRAASWLRCGRASAARCTFMLAYRL